MAEDLSWEGPQPVLRTREAWGATLDAVRARPGAWARIAAYKGETSAYKAAQKLRRETTLAAEPGDWEIVAKRLPEGGSALYARYRPRVVGVPPDGRERRSAAPLLAHAALRALIVSVTPGEAAAVLADFVTGVGGRVIPAEDATEDAVPLDISLGEGGPVVAVAAIGTPERLALEDLLPPLVHDAHRLLALRRAAEGRRSATLDELAGALDEPD